MSTNDYRIKFARAFMEWRDVGGSVDDLVDWIEGFISSKIDEVLEARAANNAEGVKP